MQVKPHSDWFILLDEIVIIVAFIDVTVLTHAFDKNCVNCVRFINITNQIDSEIAIVSSVCLCYVFKKTFSSLEFYFIFSGFV